MQSIACFENTAYVVEPFVETTFSLYSLISPMSCHSSLCHGIHAFGADLHLYPFLFWSEHGYMQAFISIALGHRQPVSQSLGVWLIHIGNNGVDLPALLFFEFQWRVEYYSDGKEVIDALESAVLFFHFLPYRMYTLGASLHVEMKSCSIEFFLYRCDKRFNILVPCFFCCA